MKKKIQNRFIIASNLSIVLKLNYFHWKCLSKKKDKKLSLKDTNISLVTSTSHIVFRQ